ncbi:MAG: serine hydrolase [Steroidobacteraceae bacterium]|nr:serine hydrolase [Steroidobacteraceae bacterium]HRX05394.1 serine hydrolase [Anaerolineae bacterium]
MQVLRWVGKAVLAIMLLLLVVLIGFYAADPAVIRRLVTGPAMGVVDQTSRNQPQEAVPGLAAPIPSAPQMTIEPAAIAAAEAYANETQSVALLIWHRGALRYEKYWPGYDQDTRTDPFSAHKSVMGLLVGAAIADGVIKSVDEPAANYLPEWRNDARKDITIQDLLQMSSGLDIVSFGSWKGLRLTLGSDLTEVALSVPAERPPGSEFQYLNLNSQLLGIILQRATGKRYAQYLSERLWSRIGAPTAYLWLDRDGGMPRTFCCLYTTARGWLQVGLLIKNRGRFEDDQVVPAQWIADMTTPAATNANYGYQIWLGSPSGQERRYNDKTVKAYHSEPFEAEDVIFIDGFGGQRVYVVPSQDLVIVRTGRVVADLNTFENNWDDARIPNAILRGIARAPKTTTDTD